MNLKKEIDKKANLWIIKENENLSSQEKDELDLWLKNRNHKKSYDENHQLIQECLSLDDEFIEQIQKEAIEHSKEETIFHRSKYIAASIIAACIMFYVAFEVNGQFQPTFEQNYVSSNQKMENLALPDQTIIDLDVNSKINVVYYKNRRTVDLIEGKALFWVHKNTSKPFIIKANKTLIEVLGTAFEVVKSKDTTQINVIEGLVRVNYLYNHKGDKKSIIQLKKAQTITLSNFGKVSDYKEIEVNDIANWKDNMIKFDKTTLKEAVSSLERYMNEKVEFENYEISQLKISGKFSILHHESFFEAVELIYPIKREKVGNIIKIVKK